MASETIILDDDYAMAATWAVEHVAALGVLDRAVLTDLFSICDKTRNLPARVEQRLVWVLLNDVVEGDGVSPHVCKMMDKLSPLTAQTSAEVAEICVRIRQAVCVRSLDSPAEFAAMVDELFPSKTGNALLKESRSDMLKVLDALESGDEEYWVEEAREKYAVGDAKLRKDMRRFAELHGQKMGGTSINRLLDDIAAGRYNPPGPTRAHAAIPRIPAQPPRTGSLSPAAGSPRRKSMLRTPSGAPRVRSPAKRPPEPPSQNKPPSRNKPPGLPAHLAFEDADADTERDAYAFDEPDAAWNALGQLAENAAALEEAEAGTGKTGTGKRGTGKRGGKVKRGGKKRARSEEDEADEEDEGGMKKRIVERGGRPAGTPVLRTINALKTRLLGAGEDDEEDEGIIDEDEGIMPTQAAPTEEDLAAERKSRRRSLGGRVLGAVGAALTWRKGKGGAGDTYPATSPRAAASPGLHLARVPSPPRAGDDDARLPSGIARRHSKLRDGGADAEGYEDKRKAGRRKLWSKEEVVALCRGYEQLEREGKLHVVNKLRPNGGVDWTTIYKMNEEIFAANERTTMDLKDKMRNLLKKKEKLEEAEKTRRESLDAAGATKAGSTKRKSGGFFSRIFGGKKADDDESLKDLVALEDLVAPAPELAPGLSNRHSSKNKKLGLAPIGRKLKQLFSPEEVDALRAGVAKHGKGRWKDILLESQHVFQDRTTMDLKDKWRNIERMAQKERAREEAAAEDSEGGDSS